MSRFDEELENVRRAALKTAAESIPYLYNILVTEENHPPYDARDILYDRLQDIWSRATIRKFLPPEAKDEEKQKAGSEGGKAKAENSARISLAEQRSDVQKEQESKSFEAPTNLLKVTTDGSTQLQKEKESDDTLSDDDDHANTDEETARLRARIAELEEIEQKRVSSDFKPASAIAADTKTKTEEVFLSMDHWGTMFMIMRNGEKKGFWCKVRDNQIVSIEANYVRAKQQNKKEVSKEK